MLVVGRTEGFLLPFLQTPRRGGPAQSLGIHLLGSAHASQAQGNSDVERDVVDSGDLKKLCYLFSRLMKSIHPVI